MQKSGVKVLKKKAHIPFDIGMSVTIHDFLNMRNNLSHPEHMHEFVELAYIRHGSCVHYIDGVAYPVKRGSLLLLNTDVIHSHICDDDSSFINVLLDLEVFYNIAPDARHILKLPQFASFSEDVDLSKPVIHFRDKERARVESLLDNMIIEYRMLKSGYDTVLHSQVNELLTLVFRKMSGVDKREFKLSPEFLQYIRDNCEKKLNLSELAAGCFYNPSYFSRLFHEHYGMTLTDFIIEARYERACYLLDETALSIEDISARCGFGSKSSFYKVFRERSGLTPKEYRKNRL